MAEFQRQIDGMFGSNSSNHATPQEFQRQINFEVSERGRDRLRIRKADSKKSNKP